RGAGKGSARRIILDHCTVTGAGLVRLVGFSQQSPIQIEANGCAVQTDALVAWEPAPPDAPLNRQSLQWSGAGNHLDIASRSWIVTAAKKTPAPTAGITNLESWSQVAQENEPILDAIEFLTTPH